MKRTLATLNFNTITPEIFSNNVVWAMPQLLALLGSEVPLKRNASGKISFELTLEAIKEKIDSSRLKFDDENLVTAEIFVAIMRLLRTTPRGDILGKLAQSKAPGIRYSAAVPLFCSAFKEFRDVKYSDWDWQDGYKKYFLDTDFLEYSNYFGKEIAYSEEELRNIRNTALYIKSGVKAGQERKPEATTTVYGVEDQEFKNYPRLYKLALAQLWVFSPQLYNKYAIVNPVDLDSENKPLISTNIWAEEAPLAYKEVGTSAIKKKDEFDLPW